MLSATDYRRAVNAAYALRLRYSPTAAEFDPFLPISVSDALRVCKLSTFQSLCAAAEVPAPPLAAGQSGFTLIRTSPQGSQSIIVYNDSQSPARQRFTLAHELGHILLQHTQDSPYHDAMADCFARNLLAPALYAQLLGIPARLYPRVFHISSAAARAAERSYAADLEAVSAANTRKVKALLCPAR